MTCEKAKWQIKEEGRNEDWKPPAVSAHTQTHEQRRVHSLPLRWRYRKKASASRSIISRMEEPTVLTAITPTGTISKTNTGRRRVGVDGQLLAHCCRNLRRLSANPLASTANAESLRTVSVDKPCQSDKRTQTLSVEDKFLLAKMFLEDFLNPVKSDSWVKADKAYKNQFLCVM